MSDILTNIIEISTNIFIKSLDIFKGILNNPFYRTLILIGFSILLIELLLNLGGGTSD